jgi:hypothetical protein
MTDFEAMRDRDRTARHEKLYGHASSAKAREQAAGPEASPASAMATRHADEVAEQRVRHHGESQELYQKQTQARTARLQTSQSMPGNFDRDHARERDELHEKHGRERSAMQRRHLTERDHMRSKRS